jgi:hypothetical protein
LIKSDSNYFDIYDDGTGIYDLSVIAQVTANLQAGLIAYNEPPTFSLLGSDGKTYNFTNNISNWINYNPSAPITPQPTPISYNPATPINQNKKPSNNNVSTGGSNSNDVTYLIVGGAILAIYLKYKFT